MSNKMSSVFHEIFFNHPPSGICVTRATCRTIANKMRSNLFLRKNDERGILFPAAFIAIATGDSFSLSPEVILPICR